MEVVPHLPAAFKVHVLQVVKLKLHFASVMEGPELERDGRVRVMYAIRTLCRRHQVVSCLCGLIVSQFYILKTTVWRHIIRIAHVDDDLVAVPQLGSPD